MVELVASAVAIADAAQVRGAGPCSCDLALVQVGERMAADTSSPGDCNCISSARLHHKMSHDELMGMGKVALNSRLHSCRQKLSGLQQERESVLTTTGAQTDKADKSVEELAKGAADLKASLAKERSEASAEKAALQKGVRDLEAQVVKFRAAYNVEFTRWYQLNGLVSRKLAEVEGCECTSKKKAALFLQQQGKDVYDTVRDIEGCEVDVDKAAGDIETAQTSAQHAAIAASNKIGTIRQRMLDTRRLDKVLTKGSQLKALKESHAVLTNSVEVQRRQVESKKQAADKIQESLKSLNAELKSCGCSV